MAYEKTLWVDHVEDPITGEVYTQGTEVNAGHLNKMESGIEAAHAEAAAASSSAAAAQSAADTAASTAGAAQAAASAAQTTANTALSNAAAAQTAADDAAAAAATAQQTADGKANASHTHAAGQVTAGTLGGQVLANASAQATLGTAQVRNIYAGTGAMTAGSTALATGAVYLQYE